MRRRRVDTIKRGPSVRGFLLKESPLADLMRAVRIVAGGGIYVDPVLAGVLAGVLSQRYAGMLATALLVGTAAGLLPAIRAARLSPTQALLTV